MMFHATGDRWDCGISHYFPGIHFSGIPTLLLAATVLFLVYSLIRSLGERGSRDRKSNPGESTGSDGRDRP